MLLGYLVTMFNKSLGVHTGYEADLREIYGDDVFAAVVPLAKDFKEAVMLREAGRELQAAVGRGEGDRRPGRRAAGPARRPARDADDDARRVA